jgi:hypothetical protein
LLEIIESRRRDAAAPRRPPDQPGSIVRREVDDHEIGVFLYALEDDLTAIWRQALNTGRSILTHMP